MRNKTYNVYIGNVKHMAWIWKTKYDKYEKPKIHEVRQIANPLWPHHHPTGSQSTSCYSSSNSVKLASPCPITQNAVSNWNTLSFPQRSVSLVQHRDQLRRWLNEFLICHPRWPFLLVSHCGIRSSSSHSSSSVQSDEQCYDRNRQANIQPAQTTVSGN